MKLSLGKISSHGEADGDGAHSVARLRDAVGKAVVATSQVVDKLHARVKVESTAKSEHYTEPRRSKTVRKG